MAQEPERYQHAEEDWDVVCEVCGTKWDFVDDKAVCPICGDTLSKVEIAQLKEEAYIRRRQKQLKIESESNLKKKKKQKAGVPKREKKIMKYITFIFVFGTLGYCFYKFCPEYVNPIVEFFQRLFS